MKDRTRISLTLRPEIVDLVDSKIDGTNIRNRSHAIEQLLKQALIGPAGQAIILAGNEQAVLTEICGETVIKKMLIKLRKASIFKIIVCCNTNATKLKKYLNRKEFADFTIIYSDNKNKGTAATIYACRELLDPETFLVLYGDIMAEIDLFDFIDFHESHTGLATLTMTSVPDPLPWGVVKVKRNRVIDFFEKPTDEMESSMRLTNLINAGIYAFHPDIFSYITSTTKHLETDVIPKLVRDRMLYSYLLDGAWFNISRPEALAHAQKHCIPKRLKKMVQ